MLGFGFESLIYIALFVLVWTSREIIQCWNGIVALGIQRDHCYCFLILDSFKTAFQIEFVYSNDEHVYYNDELSMRRFPQLPTLRANPNLIMYYNDEHVKL